MSAVGVLAFVAFATVVYPALVAFCVFAIVRLLRRAPLRPLNEAVIGPLAPALRWILPLVSVVVLAVLALVLSAKAHHYADAVQAGKPVRFGVLAVTSFKVRATPVRIGVIGRPDDQPELDALKRRSRLTPPLLYLGEADGIAVLYDSLAQAAIYVPVSSVVMRLSNCELSGYVIQPAGLPLSSRDFQPHRHCQRH